MRPSGHGRLRRLAVSLCLLGLLLAPPALGGGAEPNTLRISVDSTGVQGNLDSDLPSISANGRFVAFTSHADNLVPGDSNGVNDIFVRDLKTGTTTRVSVDSAGAQGNGQSTTPSISANGRFVAFGSQADNLVLGDSNGEEDIFVRDLKTGTTTRVSVDSAGAQANDGSFVSSISANGRFVAFASLAVNLVPGDTNKATDVFVRDLKTGATTRVSVDSAGAQGNSASDSPSISANGRFVAFRSAADNLVPGDSNGAGDIFVRNLKTGATTRVSVDSAGVQGNGQSTTPSISANGRSVAFRSAADSLVPGDSNVAIDIFARDLRTGTTTRVSVDSAGVQANNGSGSLSISANGRSVAFASDADNLVPGDSNGATDSFVRVLKTGTTTRASVDSAGVQANSESLFPSISANGRFVAFVSFADNLVPGDTNGAGDVFVRR